VHADLVAIAQKCIDGAYDDSLSFPEAVRLLIEAGFEGYSIDYRSNTRTYYAPDGSSLVLDNPPHNDPVSAAFDKDGVAASIKWAQSGAPDYNYVAFNRRVTAHGCAGYLVSFLGRRVVYYGRTGELHVEHFPQ